MSSFGAFFNKPQRVVLIILTTLSIIHFCAFIILLSNKHNLYSTSKNARASGGQQALIDLFTTSSLPSKQLKEVVHKFNQATLTFGDAVVGLTLSKNPAYPLHQYSNQQRSKLNDDVKQQARNIYFSYELSKGCWLNYSTQLTTNLYHITSWIAIIELSVIIILLFYSWSIMRFTIPLQAFKESAEQLGISNVIKPLNIPGPSIVQETASAINKMQQRIQDLIYTRTKLSISISHDLRTPITRLKLLSQFIDDKKIEHKLLASLNEMEDIIKIILEFARGDHTKEDTRNFDVVSLIETICEEMEDLGHMVEFKTGLKCVPLQGRKLAIKLAIVNLVTNAAKYGKNIMIALKVKSKSIIISITDDGPCIPEHQIMHVFQPFYRAGNYQQPGFGLGLAISAEIIHAHNGTIALHNNLPRGLVATITLPMKRDS